MTNTTTTASPSRTPLVGDILVSSWGYEQTNIDFYRVVKVTSARATIIPMGKITVQSGAMSGKVVPNMNQTFGTPMSRSFKSFTNWENEPSYGVKINSYERATPWSGEAMEYTSYH